MRIIELSGKMGVGKDYVADELIKILKARDNKVERLAFADPLRRELDDIVRLIKCNESVESIANNMRVTADEIKYVIDLLDTDPQFNDPTFSMKNRPKSYRELMQYWGTDVRRARNKDYWVNKIVQTIREDTPFIDVFVITDARFANEIRAIIQFPYAFTVRLNASDSLREKRVKNRDGVDPSNLELNHSSENAINDDDVDMLKNFDMIAFSTGNNGEDIAKDIAKEYLIDPPFDNDDEPFD